MNRFLKSFCLLMISAFASWSWAAGESINIKFNNGSFDNDTDYGCYPVKGSEWQIACNGASGRSGGEKEGTITLKDGVSVHYSTSAHWTVATAGINTLLDAYLDDGAVGGHGTTITVSGLDTTMYANYDVLIYMTADTTPTQSKHFKAPTVNGKQYTLGGQGTDNWGSVHSLGRPRIGINCLPVYGLQATESNNELTISVPSLTQNDRINGRASISAIQILPAGKIQPYEPSIFDSAISEWTFESSKGDLRGKVSAWAWNYVDTGVYVDSLRKDTAGIAYKAAKITSDFHPGVAYDWGDDDATYTIATYVNLEKCSNNGAVVSVGGNALLRKKDAKTIQFGDKDDTSRSVEAGIPHLSSGYHLIVAKKSPNSLSLKIDNEEMITVNNTFTLSNGLQMGVRWGGGFQAYDDNGNGPIIDDVVIWKKKLTDDEMSQLVACYPVKYPTLSMEADTDESGALSWSEITAVVGGSIVWNVSGKVTISLDADVSSALTALTLIPANASGDSLTVKGAGSLYGDTFALTTAIPVDITNQKNNPTITLSGTGNVTIRKGQYGIAPVANDYTGTFTVDDGQQITRMSGDLTIPFTVGEGGATLHSNGANWTVTSTISGSGTLTIESPNRWIAVTNKDNDFTGNVVVNSGTFYVGNLGDQDPGSDACLGNENSLYTVKPGATFYTHLGGDNKTFAPNITLEDGATFGNRDGHVTYNGDITINGNATYNFYWSKQNTFAGVVSGTGTLTINGPDNEDGTCEIRLTNAENNFTGTYKLVGKNDNRKIKLVACATTGAASYNLTNAYSILAFSGDVTANTLTGSAGTVESNDSTVRTLILNGNSDVRNLTFTNVNLVIASRETFVNANTVATANDGTTVKVVLTADEMLNGAEAKTAPAQNAEVTYVFLDADGTTVLKRGNSNVYEPAMNTWTSNVDNNWDTAANWSTKVLPSETANVEIQISRDTELKLNSNVTVASLRVTGTGTLTISGGELTASIIDAQTDISASETTLTLAPMNIEAGKTVTYTSATNAAMPALTGPGTFIKAGAAKLTLGNTTACEPTIDITSGTLELNSDATYDSVYHFIARDGATIDIARAAIHMPSTESEITLEGGAKLKLQNGNSSSNRHIGAKIRINESSADNPAIIVGSYYGNNTNLTGGITGSGLLEIRSEHANSFTISGAIKDQEGAQLAVKVSTTAGVTFSGTNTYTGGTVIAEGAKLTMTYGQALGTGPVTGAGTLEVRHGAHPGENNIGQYKFNDSEKWTGTVKFFKKDDSNNVFNTVVNLGDWQNAKSSIVVDAGTTINVSGSWTGTISGTGTLSIPSGKELTYASTEESTFGGVIAGAGGLTVNDGTLILTGANTYNGATTIAKGAKVIANTTSRASNNTLNSTWDYKSSTDDVRELDITVNGELEIQSSGELYRGFAGDGKITTSGSVTIGMTGDSGHVSGLTNFKGELIVATGTTLTLKVWSIPYNITLKSLMVNGTITREGGNGATTEVVVKTQNLSGIGTIEVPVTFADGATIDATKGAVTVTGTVMYPKSGAITVNATNYGDVLKAASPDATKFTLATGLDGLLVATNAALVYTAKPTLPENTTGVSDETIAEIAQMAAASEITNVTIEGAELAPAVGDTPAKKVDVAGLELFNNVPVTITQGENGSGTATISYAFGIQDITIDANDKIVVTAKVDKLPVETQEGEVEVIDEAPTPTFVNGVTVTLYNDKTPIGSATVNAGANTVEIKSTNDYMGIIGALSEGETSKTLNLTIKASK